MDIWLSFTSVEKVAEEIICLRKGVMVYNPSGKGTGEVLKCPKDDKRNTQSVSRVCEPFQTK